MSGDAHLRATRSCFDRGAARYDALAGVQREVAARLMEELAEAGAPARILEAGCGSGQLTRLLLARFPEARVDAFDVSARMLEAARAAAPGAERVRWIRSDFEHYTAPAPYPLIASSSALHWAGSLPAAAENLARLAAPGGGLAIALMLEGTLEELHAARARAAPRKAPPGRMPRADEVRAALEVAGFNIAAAGTYERESAYGSARELLHELHAQGLTGGTRFRPAAALTRGELEALAAAYPGADGGEGVRATYRIGWFRAVRESGPPCVAGE